MCNVLELSLDYRKLSGSQIGNAIPPAQIKIATRKMQKRSAKRLNVTSSQRFGANSSNPVRYRDTCLETATNEPRTRHFEW